MNQIATQQRAPMDSVGMTNTRAGAKIAPQTLAEVVKFAEVMCRADIALPKHLRGNAGACMAVAMQALEWEMSPFAVASKSYEVGGRIAYEAQLIAAVVNSRSGIRGRLKYSYEGEGASLTCTVTGVLDGEECVYTSPTVGSITTKNSPLWKSDVQQQLGYFSARSWARRHCPEVILGVYDRDEAQEFRGPDNAKDVTPGIIADPLSDEPIHATQQAISSDGGYSGDDYADEGHDAVTGEIIDNSNPGSVPSEPVDDAAPPAASASEVAPSASDVPLTVNDRALLIECCAKFMDITVRDELEPVAKRKVLEQAKDAWKKELRVEMHPKLAGMFMSADAIIRGKANRSTAINEFAGWLDCTPAELGG